MIKLFRRHGKIEPVMGLEVFGGPADGAFYVPDTSRCCCVLFWLPNAVPSPDSTERTLSLASGMLTAIEPEPGAWGNYELHDHNDEGEQFSHYCYVADGVRVATEADLEPEER